MAASDTRRERCVAAYQHPAVVRISHWVMAPCLVLLAGSGLEIFRAFPSFGEKIPQRDLVDVPDLLTIGGWLGGALQVHLATAWPFLACGALYAAYQLASGNFRQIVVTRRDLIEAAPMALNYLGRGARPVQRETYNPLQKLAYTVTLLLGAVIALTGLVLYKPVQLEPITSLLGGFARVRVWHFAAMCGFVAFVPAHLVMVACHGWSNFASMFTGWKVNPENAHQLLEQRRAVRARDADRRREVRL